MRRQRLLAPPGADDRTVAPMRWFARTFGLAVVALLVGNPAGWRGDEFGGSVPLVAVSAVLGMAGLTLLVRPDVRVLGAAAALTSSRSGSSCPSPATTGCWSGSSL